jgi:hypothetical protein
MKVFSEYDNVVMRILKQTVDGTARLFTAGDWKSAAFDKIILTVYNNKTRSHTGKYIGQYRFM